MLSQTLFIFLQLTVLRQGQGSFVSIFLSYFELCFKKTQILNNKARRPKMLCSQFSNVSKFQPGQLDFKDQLQKEHFRNGV